MTQKQFEALISEALSQDFTGWDFSWLRNRWSEAEPSRHYDQIVQNRVGQVETLLDMGTGGGSLQKFGF